ncbi:MAG: right-handed parallel beta-helix repeat-containing protein [Clostridia bacterium]|nr:right-handed parallel beta-helix repeat-containing protein [Clostridia bacterium]
MKHYKIECTEDFQEKLQALLDDIEGDAVFHFEPGVYPVIHSIRLTEDHRNIRFTSNGDATFIGGHHLTKWLPVAGTSHESRLDPAVRDKIVYFDLDDEGLPTTLKHFVSRGFSRTVGHSHSELTCNGKPLHLAQYPRGNGFTKITAVPATSTDEWGDKDGLLENGFYWHDDHLKKWDLTNEIWVLGYWKYDWANSMEEIDTVDPNTGLIKMKAPYGNYGYRVGERIRFYNVIEELTQPGDFFLDFVENRVFLYPVEDMSQIILSVSDEPVFFIDHSEKITIENLNIESTCGFGITAEFSEKLRINNCRFRNIGSYAVNILEGHDPLVENCTIHDCGDGGIICYGGNRLTLEPMNAQVNNNHIYNIAKWSKCYQTAIFFGGVGMSASHNLIHNCPHTAIMYWGNEMKIKDNEIYSVVMETGDAGAIYTGKNYTFRGKEVSHNYIHHLGGVGIGTMGIYNDDWSSGTKMCENYFEELTRAIQLGGGRDFIVKNNVFVKCTPAVHFDSRGADIGTAWITNMVKYLWTRFYQITRYPDNDPTTERNEEMRRIHTETVSAMESEYIKRYPELARYDEFFRNQLGPDKFIPGQARIESNVFMSSRKFRYRIDGKAKKVYDHGREVPLTPMLMAYINDTRVDIRRGIAGTVGELVEISNMQATRDDFVDVDWGNLEVKRSRKTFQHNYMPSRFSDIGLKESFRRINPANVKTRVEFLYNDMVARIGLRNLKGETVTGTLTLDGSKDVELSSHTLAFEVGPNEEKYYEVPVLHAGPDAIIGVRADVPGVRPSRSC